MKIEIDQQSGFCFGVIRAITIAESELSKGKTLYCLGDIVHNGAEVERLRQTGLKTLSREEYFTMKNCRVLIRAHGEPPETYAYALENNITLIDATCPVVLQLQKRIKSSFSKIPEGNGQLVIFGKQGHAEIEGLNGQIGNKAIIIQEPGDLGKIDFSKPVELYSQTTMPVEAFREIAGLMKEKAEVNTEVRIRDTICRQVANRGPHLKEFARRFDLIIFVSGKKSSNGAVLFAVCQSHNPNSYQIENPGEMEPAWFTGVKSVGICGATSTPYWLMEKTARWIRENIGLDKQGVS